MTPPGSSSRYSRRGLDVPFLRFHWHSFYVRNSDIVDKNKNVVYQYVVGDWGLLNETTFYVCCALWLWPLALFCWPFACRHDRHLGFGLWG